MIDKTENYRLSYTTTTKKWVNSDAHKGVSGSAPLMTRVTILTLPQK